MRYAISCKSLKPPLLLNPSVALMANHSHIAVHIAWHRFMAIQNRPSIWQLAPAYRTSVVLSDSNHLL